MSVADNELRDLLALHLVPGLGPRLTAALLDRFTTADRVLRASAEELRRVPHIGDKIAQELAAAMRTVDVEKELALIEKHRVELLRLGDGKYPAALATIHNPSHLLYLRGSLTAADAKAVAWYPKDSTSSRMPSLACGSSSMIEINGVSAI